jgi:uncharacterized protein (UPF0333 family)
MKKGQVSNELLVVVGFILLILIPLLYIMYFRLDAIKTDLALLQIHFSVARIAFLVNAVGYMGDGSAMITEIYVPENVQEVAIGGNEIVFTMLSEGDANQVVQPTAFMVEIDADADPPLWEGGDEIGSGRYRVEMSNRGGTVLLAPQPGPEET